MRIDIPDSLVAKLLESTGMNSEREAVVAAVEAHVRRYEVNAMIASFGTWDIDSNESIEGGEIGRRRGR